MRKICRICLDTNTELREMNKHLLDYMIEICYAGRHSGIQNTLCCSPCEDSLKNNLDFRNKCRKSNQLLEEWENDNRQERLSIDSLHKLLADTNTETVEYSEEAKFEEPLLETTDDHDLKVEIKVEHTDREEVNDDNIEDTYHENESDKVAIKNVAIKRTNKNKDADKKQVTKKYKLRGEIAKRSEFTEFETVFDITLFATYAEARLELMGRRAREPYLSAAHRCDTCYTVYKCHKMLQFHMKWHDPSGELSHECDVCRMRFSSRGTLLKHKTNCHRGKFVCKVCPLITYQRQAMKAHYQMHQGKIYKCHCDRVFNHISSYMTHKRNVHSSRHVCGACARSFVSALGLRDHMLRMHPRDCVEERVNSVSCPPCGLSFASRQVYTVHLLNTAEHAQLAKDIIACPVCGIPFEDMKQVKEHKKMNHARGKIKTELKSSPQDTKKEAVSDVIECKLCGSSGSGARWLYQHHRRQHRAARYEAPRGARAFLCELCGRAFYKKLQLDEHMYVHSGLKPFQCETCHKAFRTKMCLRNHSERHLPASRECSHCGKKFRSAANLSNHIRSHTGLRRFVCVCCGKGFLHRNSLAEHTRTVHLNIRRKRNTNKNIY